MEEMPRRAFIEKAGVLVGAVATSAALSGSPGAAQAQAQAPGAGAPPMTYSPKKLPFDPQKIKGLSEKLLISHYDNNYSGAVKRLNVITEQLANLDFAKAPVFVVSGLKREELIATNSMILHELYFDSLGDGGEPSGTLADALRRDFGSIARWRSEFAGTGKAIGGGCGWVLLSYSAHDKRLVNQWAGDHTMTIAGGRPILVMTCMSTRTIWTTARGQRVTSMRSCKPSTGTAAPVCLSRRSGPDRCFQRPRISLRSG